ncbi:RHS repeat-associated core domain-containing protein [Leptothrix ochracea]|uniref:RHS repeat-associated core domain-containing protein n=2 Tax=Leptothrix ochracea TaxID=735331 RepID=UPI0034E1B14B
MKYSTLLRHGVLLLVIVLQTHDGRAQTTYDVDGLGHAKVETSPDITRIDRVFDDLGRPLLMQPTAPALPSVNSFDEISRLVRIDYTGGIATQFAYDGNGLNPEAQGQMTHMVDESGTTDYSYSGFGEVTRKTQMAVSAGITKTHSVQYGWGSGAGDSGHLKTLTYPSGSQIEYVYAPDGRVSQILVHPVLSQGTGPDLSASAARTFMSNMQWTAWGALKSWTTQFGTNAVRTYDTHGRLLSYPITTSLNRSLKYDLQGRVTVQVTPTSMDRLFVYDALDRLTGMTDANRYLGYAYDTSNNRTLSQVNNLALSTKLVDGTNRLASVEQWGSVLTAAGASLPTVYPQVHDNAGRLMDDGLNRYAYSDRGRLASVRNTAGVTNFLYNGLEQRVAKSGPLGTFFYTYDEAGHVLGEYDSTGAPLYEVIWLGDTPVGVLRTTFSAATSTYAATTDTVFVDHLNTPRTISNPNGGLLWTWAPYEDPYAQIVPPSAATGYVFNLRMPGQIFDKETGLFHNGHRDYNPATGRYIQPDPIGLEGGINRYGYVGGNPVSYTDPSGLCPMCIPLIPAAMEALLGAGIVYTGYQALNNTWDLIYNRPGKTPNTGEPGSCHVNPGSGQERKYGSDGKPEYDIDWDHDHGQGSPHGHNWDSGKRDNGWPISPWPRGRTSGQNP